VLNEAEAAHPAGEYNLVMGLSRMALKKKIARTIIEEA
jgi:hypothetical protein